MPPANCHRCQFIASAALGIGITQRRCNDRQDKWEVHEDRAITNFRCIRARDVSDDVISETSEELPQEVPQEVPQGTAVITI